LVCFESSSKKPNSFLLKSVIFAKTSQNNISVKHILEMRIVKIKFLVIISFLLAVTTMKGQDLFLTWEGDTLGSTHTVWGEPDSSEIVFHAVVHNNSEKWMKIKVRRNQVEMLESTSSYFCWGACFGEDIEESPDSILIPSGGSSVDSVFSGHYLPKTKIGTSVVSYTFYNMDNEDQFVKVFVNYWASPESVEEGIMEGTSISNIYPNPASKSVSIDYKLTSQVKTAKIRIVNLLGVVVKEAAVNPYAKKLTMDVSLLKSGVYFYTLYINGERYRTQQLIVR
jgi:hypothetical protein